MTLFQSIDELNNSIINNLKGFDGVEYYEDLKLDQIIFIFPLTPMTTQIVYPKEGRFSFTELLELSKEKIELNELYEPNEFTSSDLYREASFGNNLREDFIALIKAFYALGLRSEHLKNWYDKFKIKPRCRTKLNFFNETNVPIQISLSIVKIEYILAHYNDADLSMLTDLDELKKSISIVNKSFVSRETSKI